MAHIPRSLFAYVLLIFLSLQIFSQYAIALPTFNSQLGRVQPELNKKDPVQFHQGHPQADLLVKRGTEENAKEKEYTDLYPKGGIKQDVEGLPGVKVSGNAEETLLDDQHKMSKGTYSKAGGSDNAMENAKDLYGDVAKNGVRGSE
jgi:hypothetical protein